MEFTRLPQKLNYLTKPLYEEVFSEDKGAFSDYYYKEVAPESTIYVAWEPSGPESGTVSDSISGTASDLASGTQKTGGSEDAQVSSKKPECPSDPDQIKSMIHLNPYTLLWNGEETRIPYIVAVATRESLRHRGLMRELLTIIFGDLKTAHVPFAFLMPINEAIYRPFGFRRTWSWQWEEEVMGGSPGDTRKSADLCTDGELQELSDHVNKELSGRCELFTKRTVPYYRRLIKEQKASDGSLLVWSRGGHPIAAGQTGKEEYPPMMCRIMDREAYEKRLQGPGDEPFQHAYVCEVV